MQVDEDGSSIETEEGAKTKELHEHWKYEWKWGIYEIWQCAFLVGFIQEVLL